MQTFKANKALPSAPKPLHRPPPPVPSLQLGDAKRILGSLTFIQIVNTLSQVWRERERERERERKCKVVELVKRRLFLALG